jgi:hypothetical protein
MRLEEAGFLKGTESCYLALQGLHSYPALRGARIPILFTPAVPAVASAEMEILRQMSFLNGTHLEELSSSISSHRTEADINTFFHLHTASLQHASKSNWIIWGLIVASVVLILFIIYYLLNFTLGPYSRIVLLIVIAQQTIVFRNPKLKVFHLRNQIPLVLIVWTGQIQPYK